MGKWEFAIGLPANKQNGSMNTRNLICFKTTLNHCMRTVQSNAHVASCIHGKGPLSREETTSPGERGLFERIYKSMYAQVAIE